jgi:Xaa-Pro dipeptidase
LQPQVLLLAGEVTPFRNDTDRELPFRQESNFYYLSGCTVPGSFILATYQPNASEPFVNMFIPKAEPADIMWSIPPPSIEAASKTHDVSKIEHPESLPAAIASAISSLPGALFHTLPRNSPLFPALPGEFTQPVLASDNSNGAVTDAYLLTAIAQARLIKDETEVAAIRKANAISSRAHETVMRVLGLAVKGAIKKGPSGRPLLPGEWLIEKEAEAEAIFVASCRREGCVSFAVAFQTKEFNSSS